MFRGSDGAPNLLSVKSKKITQSRRKGKIFMDGVIVIRFLANSRGENILFEKQKSGKLTSLSLRCFDTITSVVYIGSN
tara:strand:+ start:137 stop:370 length:234 start_codon:yes stop_codon:yes gene_type:complete